MIEDVYRGSETVHLKDGAIRYLRRGSGPSLLLLHGVPLSMLTWRNNVESLARSFTVIALDMKGYGLSDKSDNRAENYSIDRHADVVGDLVEKLNLAKVSVAGSSYGCAVAIKFALAQPERVNKLILINSVGYPGGPHSAERLLRIGMLNALLAPTLRSVLGKQIFASRLRKSYANSRLATPELINAYFRLMCHENGERTFLATLQQFREAELAEHIPRITQETLIIWGAQDRVLPVANALRLHGEIKQSRLEIVPDSGHLPHEEAPERVNELIINFLGESAHQMHRASLGAQPVHT